MSNANNIFSSLETYENVFYANRHASLRYKNCSRIVGIIILSDTYYMSKMVNKIYIFFKKVKF